MNMKLKNIHADVWIGTILIALSIIFYEMAGSFSNQSAALWPRAVLVIIIILSVMLLIRGLRLTQQKADAELIPLGTLTGPMIAIALIILYAVLMKFTGYFISSAIFLPVGMFLLGQRNWKILLGVTAGLEIFIYVLFVTQLQLRMP